MAALRFEYPLLPLRAYPNPSSTSIASKVSFTLALSRAKKSRSLKYGSWMFGRSSWLSSGMV